jgi:hypothetical protein
MVSSRQFRKCQADISQQGRARPEPDAETDVIYKYYVGFICRFPVVAAFPGSHGPGAPLNAAYHLLCADRVLVMPAICTAIWAHHELLEKHRTLIPKHYLKQFLSDQLWLVVGRCKTEMSGMCQERSNAICCCQRL